MYIGSPALNISDQMPSFLAKPFGMTKRAYKCINYAPSTDTVDKGIFMTGKLLLVWHCTDMYTFYS